MPHPINDDDSDERDLSGAGIARRLKKVVDILERANGRLGTIRAGFTDPPDPDKPAIAAALQAILTETAKVTAQANELLGRTR